MEDPARSQSAPVEGRRRGGIAVFALAILALSGVTLGNVFGPLQFEVSSQGLRITGDLYGTFLPASELQVSAARVVDLELEREYRLWIKTNGVGLPGYHTGWFRLKNREKALVFLTSSRWAVHVPTTRGYTLLVSPEQPMEYLDALRHPAAGVQVFRTAGSR